MAHTTTVNIDDGAIEAILFENDTDDMIYERAEIALDFAHSAVPVDTGKLNESLNIKKHGPSSYAIGSDLEYAAPVELGYHHHGSGRFIPAQPYLRPSLQAARVIE